MYLCKNKSILIVEDDRQSNENMAFFLQEFFAEVFCAYDGEEAWHLYCKNRPDIVLTDIEMPRMNGLELVTKIRAKHPNTPVIVLSAYSHRNYLFKAIPLKIEEYLVKPVTYEKLKNLFGKIFLKQQFIDKEILLDAASQCYYSMEQKSVTIGKQQIRLANLEITLLELLLSKRSKIVSYEEAEIALYNYRDERRNALKIVVSNLRRKIPVISIESVSKHGYYLA